MPYVIGLTGNIATGKSVVLDMLEKLGAKTINADALAHSLMKKGSPVWKAIVEQFGHGVLLRDGAIDRGKLGERVFFDPAALRRLEKLVHPAVVAITRELVGQAEEKVVAIEAIKLIEAGMRPICDALWVVTCRKDQQLARLMAQRELSREEALLRIEAQPLQGEKVALADLVIDNSGSLEETRQQVEAEWSKIECSNR